MVVVVVVVVLVFYPLGAKFPLHRLSLIDGPAFVSDIIAARFNQCGSSHCRGNYFRNAICGSSISQTPVVVHHSRHTCDVWDVILIRLHFPSSDVILIRLHFPSSYVILIRSHFPSSYVILAFTFSRFISERISPPGPMSISPWVINLCIHPTPPQNGNNHVLTQETYATAITILNLLYWAKVVCTPG